MKPKPSSSTKAKPPLAGGFSCLLTSVLVLAAFGGGLYVGSIFFESKTTLAPTVGLPGTTNVLQSWPTQPAEQAHLRRVPDASAAPKSVGWAPSAPKPPPAPIPAIRIRAEPAATAPQPMSVPVVRQERRQSLQADKQAHMEGPADLDAADVLVSAWIYLDSHAATDTDMRTVFSNKAPGCDRGAAQHGISMTVNAWQQPDHKVYLEYGALLSGCHKLDSKSVTLLPERWYHVAALFGVTEVALFIDGAEVNREQINDPHIPQASNALLVGHYASSADTSYPLYGNISALAVVHTAEATVAIVQALQEQQTARTVAGIKAFYPLNDINPADPIVHDVVGSRHARVELPLTGQRMTGVPVTLVDGRTVRTITDVMKADSDRLGRERRVKVREGMRHAWSGYRKHAWGKDELKPISGSSNDNWGAMGMTLVDSLDTLWVLGMKEEFAEAVQWVQHSLTFAHAGSVSVFETTIRALGGLLAAYDLSNERVLLDKAKELADKLMPAFHTNSGIPMSHVNLNTGAASGGWTGSSAVLSELGSLQIEFRYLGHALGDSKYDKVSMQAIHKVLANNPSDGLYPIRIRVGDGGFADSMITFGALGDSFFEYLLKLWIQGGRKEGYLREAYDKAMDGAISKMLLTSSKTGLAFLADWDGRRHGRKMDHLVCFMPGLLTLGAYSSLEGITSERSQRDLAVARALMYTCREMYHRTPTGIAPEYVRFPEDGDMVAGYNAEFYILRPETAESLFVMAQLTGEPIYRQWAWEIWEAIDKVLRTPLAYASLHNVNQPNSLEDRMESFFLAETVKYLYLAQDPDMPIDLTKYVFNTEAHPMRVFE